MAKTGAGAVSKNGAEAGVKLGFVEILLKLSSTFSILNIVEVMRNRICLITPLCEELAHKSI